MTEPFLFGDSTLPDELDARVRSELDGGEQLLWVGQPRPSRFARAAIPAVLFGIPWTAFALLWTGMALSGLWGKGGAPQMAGPPLALVFSVCFPLWGVPFILIGLGMLSSPLWARRRAKRTCYALTDRRAILFEAGAFRSVEVRSYRPADLTKIFRREKADGSGDLVFEELTQVRSTSHGGRATSTQARGFMGIENVREIEELVRKALLSGGG
jgi:hypothetical protein